MERCADDCDTGAYQIVEALTRARSVDCDGVFEGFSRRSRGFVSMDGFSKECNNLATYLGKVIEIDWISSVTAGGRPQNRSVQRRKCL